MSIAEKQKDIVEEFAMLDGDMEMTINYIMELGEQLPEMNESLKTDDSIVKGCQSKVWLMAEGNPSKVTFTADSNTAITKGLVSLLVRVLSDEEADAIMNAEISFPQEIGMNRFIGTQRSNGFAAMIKQMKLYALALSSKTQTGA
ncbi:MAG: SufE family protein [Marinoscillum sp.]